MLRSIRFGFILLLLGFLITPLIPTAYPASETLNQSELSSATKNSNISRSEFLSVLVQKNQKSPFVPENVLSMKKDELYKAVVAKMSKSGIAFLPADGGNEPLTRIEFINVTYAFITGQAGNTYIERKYFLQDKDVIKTEDIGTVKSFEGLVNISRFQSESAIQLKNYLEPVLFKDTVETNEDSRVKIELDDESYLNIGEDTVIEISQMVFDPKKNTREALINLAHGKLRVKASKLSGAKTDFSIHTPTAVIGIRGTEFIVSVGDGGRTNIVTIEGLVAVRPITAADVEHREKVESGQEKTSTEQTTTSTEQTATEGTAGTPEATPQAANEVTLGANTSVSVEVADAPLVVVPVSGEIIGSLVQDTEVLNPVAVQETSYVSMNEATETVQSDGFANAVEEAIVPAETVTESKEESEVVAKNDVADAVNVDAAKEQETAVDTSELDTNMDTDGDGVADINDAFPGNSSETVDTDGDGIGDHGDVFPNDSSESVDTDRDGYGDNSDLFPNDAAEWNDTDGDGVGNNGDLFPNNVTEWADTDGDGVGNNSDAFPNNAAESVDTDGDEIGDNADVFPTNGSEWADTDGDGVGNNADVFPNNANEYADSDSDGVGDNGDAFPTNADEWADADGDGFGDNLADPDSTNPNIPGTGVADADGDGVGDNDDAFPNDSTEWADDDSNGIGNNAQTALLASGGDTFMNKWNQLTWTQKVSLVAFLSNPQFNAVLTNEYTSLTGDRVIEFWNDMTQEQRAIFTNISAANKSLIIDNVLDGVSSYQPPLVSKNDVAGNMQFNATTIAEISGNDYIPETYQYGLQVGNYVAGFGSTITAIDEDAFNAINEDGFLAYAVQVEEDIVNREALLAMQSAGTTGTKIQSVAHDDDDEDEEHEQHDYTNDFAVRASLMNDINASLQTGNIRSRDALLAQENDAQAGRVLLDANGYWVRVQQYVLRPNDNSVQVVNVSLRGAEAGSISGLSVMNWQTAFAQPLPGGSELLGLPWADYLATNRHGDDASVTNTSSYELVAMSVKFSHNSDSLQETRTFENEIEDGKQEIETETLTVNGTDYQYDNDLRSSDHNKYKITMLSHGQLKFRYQIRDVNGSSKEINAYFYIVGNATDSSNSGIVSGYEGVGVHDVWSALSANMSTARNAGPNIGSNNLEMRFTNGKNTSFLSAPIDIVYIPLPNMQWKTPVQ